MLLVEQMINGGADLSEYRDTVWCFDTESETDLPDNFRTMFSEGRPSNPDLGMDPDFVPSLEGLATLNLSASAQFSMRQLGGIAEAIREITESKVHILDVRQEFHVLASGKPISLFGKNNRANIGKETNEVEREEAELAKSLSGGTLEVALPLHEVAFDQTKSLAVSYALTEREAAQLLEFDYCRIAVTDRSWPLDHQVDQFVEFVKGVDEEEWVHIHCKAGIGRTGEFVVMYDILRNPHVPLKDIVYRQYQLGSAYLFYEGSGHDWMDPFDQERARMIRLFYQYVQEARPNNYALSWSEWRSNRKA